MTFSLRPITSKLSRFWRERADLWLPLAFLAVLLVHGSLLGLTDDEAYYWVLAQRPSLGYAYHPPAVAWLIAGAQRLLGGVFGSAVPGLVRLPGILCATLMLHLVLGWLRRRGGREEGLAAAGLLCLSFTGIFALSWMMVPDLPLFLGWTLAFLGLESVCFGPARSRDLVAVAFGVGLAALSKYTAVFAGLSALSAILLFAPRERRVGAVTAVVLGGLAGALPTLAWNARHEWASVIWQLRERHGGGGGPSLVRYLRFWVIEFVAAGPVLVAFALLLPRRWRLQPVYRYATVWMLPAAAVFCVQPIFSDFKPHWAFIVWWPALLAMAWTLAAGPVRADLLKAKFQTAYGLVLGVLVLAGCHYPLAGWFLRKVSDSPVDPRWDVTNDLHGWEGLRSAIEAKLGPRAQQYPVTGSWYQTASQAAFAMGTTERATLVPLDLKNRDEWPDPASLGAFAAAGPGQWPRLVAPVIFVTDNRYTAPPEYPGAACVERAVIDRMRSGYPAKRIGVWLCEPGAGRP